MSCNKVIHDELSNEYNTCPFCLEQVSDRKSKNIFCCDKQEIINDNGMNVCKKCGFVQYYNYHKEYIGQNEWT